MEDHNGGAGLLSELVNIPSLSLAPPPIAKPVLINTLGKKCFNKAQLLYFSAETLGSDP